MAATSAPATQPADAQARVARLVGDHGPTLLKVARRVSLCADDAHDAFQRALEIYLRRLDTLDPATEVAWMRVVVRNEALAVRRGRSQLVHGEEADLDAHVDSRQRSLEERVESAERVTRSAEALRTLKPDEARALLLKAEGLSYSEIGARLGWTYTKVNRCITEGRARFRKAFRGIESGEQCERFAPLLVALCAGEADADTLVRLKPHLRHCIACRADVRRLHGSRWPGAAAWLPLPGLLDRLKPSSLKAELYGLFGRLNGADPISTSLAGTGGGRSAGATALIGLCLAGAGAGGYCAVGGPLPDLPVAAAARESVPREKLATAAATATATASAPAVTPVATPTPAATPQAAGRVERPRTGGSDRAASTVANESDEFSFEASATATPVPTAVATATPAAPVPVATATPARVRPQPEPAASGSQGGEFGFER